MKETLRSIIVGAFSAVIFLLLFLGVRWNFFICVLLAAGLYGSVYLLSSPRNGLTGAMSGIYDLGMASRELKDYEKELLDYDVIAKDEVAVIVQKDNPLKNISSQDLKKIYSGEMKEWKELAD